MRHTSDGFNWLLRLNKGERLSEQLERFFTESKIQGAWVSGIGGASEAEFGIYDLHSRQYNFKTYSQPLEILSLQGSITFNPEGKPVYHLHGVFSDQENNAMGGHVKDLVVGATLELFLHRTYKRIDRSHDEDIGLDLLHI